MQQFMDVEACAANSEYTQCEKTEVPGLSASPATCAGLEECILAGLVDRPDANSPAAQPVTEQDALQSLAEAAAERCQADRKFPHWVGSASDMRENLAEGSGVQALESHSERFGARGCSSFERDWHITDVHRDNLQGCVSETWLSGPEQGYAEGIGSCLAEDFEVGHSPVQRQMIKAAMEIAAQSTEGPDVEQSTGLMLAQRRETALIKVAQQEQEIRLKQTTLKNSSRQVVHGGTVDGDLTSTGIHPSIRKLPMVRDIPEIQKPKGSVPKIGDSATVDRRVDALDKSQEKRLLQKEVQALHQSLLAAEASAGTLADNPPCALPERLTAEQSRTRASNSAQSRMLRS